MEQKSLADQFEQNRAHLRAVAYRMLGSTTDADDAVQDAWLKVSRADAANVQNLGGWLTTIVARVCLDMLRARKSRGERPATLEVTDTVPSTEQHALLDDSVGIALLVVLETLAPTERLAFVLHDLFDLPFDEIAPIVGCSSGAARQLASRARRRVQGRVDETTPDADLTRQREVVDAFLAASRSGDLSALLALLDPDIVLRADAVAVATSRAAQSPSAPKWSAEARGAADVAQTFLGRAQAAQPALIDGTVGAAWAPGGEPRALFIMLVEDGKVVEIQVVADRETIGRHHVVLLPRADAEDIKG